MSKLEDLLLNPRNIQILAQIHNNYNLINHVPMPELLHENDDYDDDCEDDYDDGYDNGYGDDYDYDYDRGNRSIKSRKEIMYEYDKPEIMSEDCKIPRRSRYDQYGRVYTCFCGKSFLSFQALGNHKRVKHPNIIERLPPRVRGRPRKNPPKPKDDFETTKYGTFFDKPGRGFKEGKYVDVDEAAKEAFKVVYESVYSSKLFILANKLEDNYILNNLISKVPASWKPKNEKNCDEIFYEYLNTFKAQTNHKFFVLMIIFVLLFRECFNLFKNKDVKKEHRKFVSDSLPPEELPDICNYFYIDFLEPNNFLVF
jgi:hypothetical protein